MNKYLSITFSAVFLLMAFFPCQVLAASITETSAAIGKDCAASANYATAMGFTTTASGDHSTAMGRNTWAYGNSSTAMGWDSVAQGMYSTAMGLDTRAIGLASTTMGSQTKASGFASTAMGFQTKAGGIRSFAGGLNMQLSYAADHTFVWGDSESEQSISTANAFLIFPAGTPGKVGIGTPNPRHLLDLGNTKGKKLAVYQSTSGDDFYGFGISGGLLEMYAGANTGDIPAMVIKKLEDSVGKIHGFVGINNTSPGQRLDIGRGNGRVEPTFNWLTDSDIRLKKNISTLEGSLEKISRLRGVRFDSKEAVHVDNGGGKHIGVIAQELEKEYPELVVGDKKTGYKAVAYDKLTAVLIEAVKELKTQNQSQREALEKQQTEIEELRSMIKASKG